MSRLASIPYADLTARQRYLVGAHLRRYYRRLAGAAK